MNKNIWIDKSVLPKKNKQIDWRNSIGIEVPFKYNRYSGKVKICEWKSDMLTIQYEDTIAPIKIRSFAKGKLGKALKFRNYEWIYDIGDIHETSDGTKYEIVDRKIEPTTMSQSSRFYKCVCKICGEASWFFENSMDVNCPVCNNRNIVPGKNDLWTTHEYIAKQLLNPEDGKAYSLGKRVYLDWKCPTCGEIRTGLTPMQVYKTLDKMVPCRSCSDGYSYPNKFMFNILTSLGIDFDNEKNFKWSGLGKRKYDFYLPQYSMIIEMHGDEHFKGYSFKDLKKIKTNDWEKRKIAIDNGIKEYIVIDSSVSNAKYIFENILNSRLTLYIDFDGIDIMEIDKKASRRIRQRVFDVLETVNYDFTETARQLKITRCTVSRYVNDSIKKNLIDERIIREAQRINKIRKHYQKEGQPYHCIELDLYFGSGRELKNYLINAIGNKKVSLGTIVSQGIERHIKAYGYTWEKVSRELYNGQLEEAPEKCFGDRFEIIK